LATARAAGRRRRGYRALTRGLVAAAAGDGDGARRAARDAEGLLGEPPLTMLLTAQAAQLDGDDAGTEAAFRMMLDDPETEFLGLRGLLVQAMRADDKDTALALARRAFEINPRAGWVLTHLADLEIAAGDWGAAERRLAAAVAGGTLDPGAGQRRRGALLYQQALAAESEGRAGHALVLARQAVDRAPGLVPAWLLAARLLTSVGKRRQAQNLIRRGWAQQAHPDLAAALLEASGASAPLDRVKALEPLIAARPAAPEGHLAVAEAALEAELWGPARDHLDRAAATGITVRLCTMMARLEEAEDATGAGAGQWLRRATGAAPDPTWVCTACGGVSAAWRADCPHCAAFDGLDWRVPAGPAMAPGPSPAAPIPAPSAPGKTL
jgi:HemY protein